MISLRFDIVDSVDVTVIHHPSQGGSCISCFHACLEFVSWCIHFKTTSWSVFIHHHHHVLSCQEAIKAIWFLWGRVQPVRCGWPYQEYKTPADIHVALGVIETHKLLHHDKVVTPFRAGFLFNCSIFVLTLFINLDGIRCGSWRYKSETLFWNRTL